MHQKRTEPNLRTVFCNFHFLIFFCRTRFEVSKLFGKNCKVYMRSKVREFNGTLITTILKVNATPVLILGSTERISTKKGEKMEQPAQLTVVQEHNEGRFRRRDDTRALAVEISERNDGPRTQGRVFVS